DAIGRADQEVVDQRSVRKERLGAYAGGGGSEMALLDRGEKALERPRESPLRQRPQDLRAPGSEVPRRETPEARIAEDVEHVAHVHVAPGVALAGEGEHGVRATLDSPADRPREVDAQEREARVGHGIDEVADEAAGLGREVVVLHAVED